MDINTLVTILGVTFMLCATIIICKIMNRGK